MSKSQVVYVQIDRCQKRNPTHLKKKKRKWIRSYLYKFLYEHSLVYCWIVKVCFKRFKYKKCWFIFVHNSNKKLNHSKIKLSAFLLSQQACDCGTRQWDCNVRGGGVVMGCAWLCWEVHINPDFNKIPKHAVKPCYDMHRVLNFAWRWVAEGLQDHFFSFPSSFFSQVLMRANTRFGNVMKI